MTQVSELDREGLFRLLCRQKGTRCDAIMTMIERGCDDAALKKRFGLDAATAGVYRKAFENTLTEPKENTTEEFMYLLQDRQARMLGLIRAAFAGSGERPTRNERYTLNRERFKKTLFEASGEKVLAKAGRKCGLSEGVANTIYRQGYTTAGMIGVIYETCGINLYREGIAVREDEETGEGAKPDARKRARGGRKKRART